MYSQTTFQSIQQTLSLALTNVATSLISFIPQLLAAIIVFLIGLILGGWLKALVKGILQALNLSTLIKNSAIDAFLKRAEVRYKIEELIGEILRWLVIYIFLIASLNVLGLTTVSAFLSNILSYLPKVISASLIFTVGVVLAGFTESLVKSAVSGVDVATGRLVGKGASYTVVVFTTLVAIGELGIAQQFIYTLFIGFVAMLSLGLGLAFGLGAKDIVHEMMDTWYHNLKKELKRK